MGNPHAIFWVEDAHAYDLAAIGPLLEHDPVFPERANISLAQVTSPEHIVLRVWERGAGADPRLRLRRLRDAGRGRAQGADRPQGRGDAARRRSRHRMARERRPCAHDRPDRAGARGHPLACPVRRARPDGASRSSPSAAGSTPTSPRRCSATRKRRASASVVIVNTCAVTAEATRQARQSIRKLAREKPDARIVVTGCAAQVEPETFAAMPEVSQVRRQRREDEGRDLGRHARFRRRRKRKGSRQRHHGGEGNRRASHRRHARAHPRLRAGAERLRPPLHLLHHPLRPRQFPLRAHGRGGGPGAHPRRARLARGGAHRRRHHQLRHGPAGRAEARHPGEEPPAPRAGAGAPAHLLHRLGRGGRRPARRDRDRAPPDAASASLAAGRRRHGAEAHEAPPSARRRDRASASRCSGFAPTWSSAPTSSRAFRPRPRRCSRAPSTSSRNAA